MDKDRQRELKQSYKETKLPMGVYQVRNKVNGRIFIGSASNVSGKLNSIRFQLGVGSYRCAGLQKEWLEFGEDGFEFEILELLDQDKIESYLLKDELKKLEKKWLEKLEPYGDKGYN